MPPTRTAVAGDDGSWRPILLAVGAAGVAVTGYKILKGQKVGAMELLGAAAFVVGLLTGE